MEFVGFFRRQDDKLHVSVAGMPPIKMIETKRPIAKTADGMILKAAPRLGAMGSPEDFRFLRIIGPHAHRKVSQRVTTVKRFPRSSRGKFPSFDRPVTSTSSEIASHFR